MSPELQATRRLLRPVDIATRSLYEWPTIQQEQPPLPITPFGMAVRIGDDKEH